MTETPKDYGHKVKVDPRFKRESKKKLKLAVDERFQAMFNDKEFVAPVSVDKYGRPVRSDRDRNDLKNYYRLENDNEEEGFGRETCSSSGNNNNNSLMESSLPLTRKKVVASLAESSLDKESDPSSSSEEEEEEEIKDLVMDEALSSHPLVAQDMPIGEATNRLAIVNLDWDQIRADDIYTLLYAFKPMTGSIQSVKIYPSKFGKERMAREAIEGPSRELFTRNKEDIKEESSIKRDNEKRTLRDDSNFHDESRLPPPLTMNTSSSNGYSSGTDNEEDKEEGEEEDEEDEEDEMVDSNDNDSNHNDNDNHSNHSNDYSDSNDNDDNGKDYNEVALRRYQLERLRYYYAVVECDSVSTALHIYKNCDGSEVEKSANFIDLRFIPDSVTFTLEEDGCPQDVCYELPKNYRVKSDFVTPALQMSKISLTWDDDNAERVRVTRQANTTKFDIEEADLKAYLASSSDNSDLDLDPDGGKDDESKNQYRKLLLSSNDDGGSVFGRKSSREGCDLKITFASALREERAEAKTNDRTDDSNPKNDPFTNQTVSFDDIEETSVNNTIKSKNKNKNKDDNDDTEKTPFEKYLERRQLKKKARKEAISLKKEQQAQDKLLSKNNKKRKSSKSMLEMADAERNQLGLLVDDLSNDDEDITRKNVAGATGSKRQKKQKLYEDNVDVDDPRFSAVFEEAAFALDPSHPAFKKTKGTQKIIKERQRRIHNNVI